MMLYSMRVVYLIRNKKILNTHLLSTTVGTILHYFLTLLHHLTEAWTASENKIICVKNIWKNLIFDSALKSQKCCLFNNYEV